MGAKAVYSGNSYTAATETDLYTNTSTTENSIALKVGIYNPSTAAVTVSVWVTDGSNNHVECLFSGSVAAATLITDGSKTILLPGYKIRFTSSVTTTLLSASIWAGLA